MKIDPTGPQRSTAVSRKNGAANARGGNFAKALADSSGSVATGHAVALGAVNPMLALQEVPDAIAARTRAKRRGDQLLEKLEAIRLGLLAGAIPRNQLEDIAEMVRAGREDVDDARLNEVLDEIDLRAAVELAKFSRPG